MVIYAPGGRASYAKDINEAIDRRKDLVSEYPDWSRRVRLDDVDITQLETIQNICTQKDRFKVRVEEPLVQIYADTVDDLKYLAERFDFFRQARIVEISYPKNNKAAELLKQGKILRRSPQDYRFKIMLRDGAYHASTKEQILNYLESLGDLVKITEANKKMMQRSYSWIWSVYFYSNDDSIATFLNLIHPGLISNIYEITQVDQ